MKGLILLATLLSVSAFGRQYDSIRGDKVHFQSESTWVSAVYNKTLCVDGDVFRATITKCMEWQRDDDNRRCVRRGKIQATQPMESTRLRCSNWGDNGDHGGCREWVRVRYYQNPVKEVQFLDEDDHVLFTETVTVPNCQ